MSNFKRLVGQKIQNRRIALGFKSQGELAAVVGVDTSRLSRWETGENTPEGAHKKALLKALSADESLLDIDMPNPTRGELILKIVEILPALNDDQLGTVALLIGNLPRVKIPPDQV